jgi:SagB-type dehydrogenase family enzyme
VNDRVRTLRGVEVVHGPDGPRLDDPAENYHEASKVYARLVAAQLPGVALLHARRDLQVTAQRSVRRNPEVDWHELPRPRVPGASFRDVLASRRSAREFGREPLGLAQLSTLLHCAYGVTHAGDGEQRFRAAPSGGALYPLELYVAATAVAELAPGVYHYDPLRGRIGEIGGEERLTALKSASAYPAITSACAIVVFVAAVFARTRFKYALRGYRFALLEAGHVVQNLLLAATALDLASVPLGGYYDRAVDNALELDGVNEATVYAACIGSRL